MQEFSDDWDSSAGLCKRNRLVSEGAVDGSPFILCFALQRQPSIATHRRVEGSDDEGLAQRIQRAGRFTSTLVLLWCFHDVGVRFSRSGGDTCMDSCLNEGIAHD